ncbi:putative short-chain dehydrogenases/reductase [Mytilinidion resinicola]|uniref:Short-chain dehydrogenases/reductase n=1 Tax=Mytilinidion resinicola TaxID=574789 RepID=A0A6A6YKJ3_9PEZI|nr:putative short-chain dehydrogenases/reductase [Mytilinidion resinicola]KAF2809386.1 putative short-chain dehydrogenases/reductase [Mytilinidion resinicola]
MAARETVLIVGATGNIGIAAVLGALRAQLSVLAIVRNQTSADKLFQHIGTQQYVTVVEADITSDQGVQGVVEQVKAGKLPSFQHVYAAAGGAYWTTPLKDLSTQALREFMNVNFETNFFAYRATIPYLLEQNADNSSWTLCTGSQGDLGLRAAPAISQGALFSMASAAARENVETNIRFNEVYLACRVEVDESAEKTGAMRASRFADHYETVLSRPEIRGCRISVFGDGDLRELRCETKIKNPG